MATTRTIAEINQKIRAGRATVWTVEEAKVNVADMGLTAATAAVDVVTTGTFEPMESSGAIINLGHTDPPINIRECYLDGVMAYAGFGAVDLYLGASQVAGSNRWGDASESDTLSERGGGHVIAQLIAGKSVHLDRKSTRLNSSHLVISYAVFCLKKKTFFATIPRCRIIFIRQYVYSILVLAD